MAAVSDVIKNVYFNTKNNGFFVECGANDGISASDSFGLEKMGWKGINIEAQNSCYQSLIRNRPNSINLNYALCDKDDCDLTFIVTSQHGNSSLEHSNKHKQELIQLRNSTFTEQKVPAISWKRLISSYQLTNINVLILDIEGCEKYVLENMKNCDVIPDVICIEVGYEWGPKKELLKELGYRFDLFHGNNAYCSKPSIQINENQKSTYRQERFDWWDVTIYDVNKDAF
jgi:FkbM family methyltransferase